MITYNNDPVIRFDHTPVINKFAFQVNQVGPDDPYVFPEVDYDDTDDNTIYVDSESPGDDSNPGTYAAPKRTLLAAINATTATKTKVVIKDDATVFNEDISGGTFTYLQGIYQMSTGGTSSWIGRQLGFEPDDTNAIWVSKAGADDTSADGTRSNPYLTINYAKDYCDATKNVIVIDDSGTYEEDGFTFEGNFTGLYAAIGETPVLVLSNPDITVGVFSEVTVDGVGNYSIPATYPYNFLYDKAVVLENGNVVVGFRESNLLKYKIVDKDGGTVLSSTTVSSGDISGYQMRVLVNGDIVFAYRKTSDLGFYFSIKTQTGGTTKAETMMAGNTWGGLEYFSISELYDNGFVVAYCDSSSGNNGYFRIYDNNGSLVTTVLFHPGGAPFYIVIPLKSVERFVIVSNSTGIVEYYGCYWIYSNSGNLIKSATYVYGPYYYSHGIGRPQGASFSNGYFAIVWREEKSGATYYQEPYYGIWDYNGNVVKTPDLCYTYTNVDYIHCFVTQNDYLIVTLVENSDTDAVKFVYYNSSGTFIQALTAYPSSPDGSAVALLSCQDNACHIYQRKNGSAICQHTFFGELLFSALINDATGGAVINGITIDEDGIGGLYSFIYSNNPLTVKWSEFRNGTPTTIGSSAYIVIGELTAMQNCKCHDCNNGLNLTMNTVEITETQFYRINEGYAIDNDGAGSGISIEHCDFFACYGGLRLQNNNGNEVVKNNIFHDMFVYAINADANITVTYCVARGSITSTVTLGAYTTRGNPNYVNEGYANPDDIDLNLRVKVIGYPGNSAAYMLADDNRNAGSIDVKYIGEGTTYTSITIPKPNTIQITYLHSGATNTQRKDGSWTSGKDGQSEVITMTWEGIRKTYADQLLEMWKSDDMNVLIYPDPVTSPTAFEQWTIMREPVEGGVESPTLSGLGAQGMILKFAKAI